MAGKRNMGGASGFQRVKTSGKTKAGSLDAFYQKLVGGTKKTGPVRKKAPKK